MSGFGFIPCRYSTPRAHCRHQLMAWAAVYSMYMVSPCNTNKGQKKLTRSWELFITNRSKTWNLYTMLSCSVSILMNQPTIVQRSTLSIFHNKAYLKKNNEFFLSGHQSVNKMAVKRSRPFDGGANIPNSNGA